MNREMRQRPSAFQRRHRLACAQDSLHRLHKNTVVKSVARESARARVQNITVQNQVRGRRGEKEHHQRDRQSARACFQMPVTIIFIDFRGRGWELGAR